MTKDYERAVHALADSFWGNPKPIPPDTFSIDMAALKPPTSGSIFAPIFEGDTCKPKEKDMSSYFDEYMEEKFPQTKSHNKIRRQIEKYFGGSSLTVLEFMLETNPATILEILQKHEDWDKEHKDD